MRARPCEIVAYTYSGTIIEEKQYKSVREALSARKVMKERLCCYTTAIYDAETKELIK